MNRQNLPVAVPGRIVRLSIRNRQERDMRLPFTHPVVARGLSRREGHWPRTVVGTVVTEVEIEERSASELVPAFLLPGSAAILALDGAYYRESGVDIQSVVGQGNLDELLGHGVSDVLLLSDEFHEAMRAAISPGSRSLLPATRRSAFDHPGGLDQHGSLRYLHEAGPISRRSSAAIDEGDVEGWRDRARAFAASFVMVGGVTYERCHEPLLVAMPGEVVVSSFGIFERHAGRTVIGRDGWPVGGSMSQFASAHAFPVDMHAEALELALAMDWAEIVEVAIEISAEPMPLWKVLEFETARFAKMHVRDSEAVAFAWARRTATDAEAEKQGAYLALAEQLRAVLRSTARPSAASLDDVFVGFAEAGKGIDRPHVTAADWKHLASNTERLMERKDSAPIHVPRHATPLPGL